MSLKINFYCDEKYYGCLPEPLPAAKTFPKWFADIPLDIVKKFAAKDGNIYDIKIFDENKNIKKCLGISEFLNTGYIIPSWADFVFREQEDGNLYINWVENEFDETSYSCNEEHQYATLPNKPIYGHFGKIFTPWTVTTDRGVSCLITHPVWHNNKSFTTATAVFHTDACPLNLAWFFEWNYKIRTKMNIENIDLDNQVVPKGEPIILVIPFYRKKFSHKINYVSERKIRSMSNSYLNSTHKSITGNCPYLEFKKTLGKLF